MATSLLKSLTPCVSRLAQNILSPKGPFGNNLLLPASSTPALDFQFIRTKKTKAKTKVKNKIVRGIPKHRGIKVEDGEFVHEWTILATQYGMRYYPGEFVNLEQDCTLRAGVDGIVVITTDNLNPYPDSPLYEPVQAGLKIPKKFFHILPIPLHGKFRLISET